MLHQIHLPLLQSINILQYIVYSLQQWIKGKYTEPTIDVILCWYIKGKGSKIFQEAPHLPLEIYSSEKNQDNIWWDNMMWG